ncbi:MAG TPA: hypothetical protein VGS99_09470, partial [Gammaproteobacteria bacterium]|nr:hypothetical protein [Gammaproteobacteria bacterium]
MANKPPAANSQAMADACKQADYQCINTPIVVSLKTQDGLGFSSTLPPPTPVIQDKQIVVYPGQTLNIEAAIAQGQVTNLRLVDSVTHPEKTLVVSLKQVKSGAQYLMMLDIHNPFDAKLKYHAGIMPLEEPKDVPAGTMYKTSTCPVMAKGGANESWNNSLFQVVLADIH